MKGFSIAHIFHPSMHAVVNNHN
ncbi:TPA: hypothetical protein ACHJ9X_004883, partial [Escherichia coli]